jgi:unsaturated rhamnogalacturonyl hydrolase
MKRMLALCPIMAVMALCAFNAPVKAAFPTKQEVIDDMVLVNDYWINGHSDSGDNKWARATYFEGNMAMYKVYPDQKYYNYAHSWAVKHNWKLNGGDSTRHADNQCAGQTYLELHSYDPQPYKIAHIKASIDNMVNSTKDNDWWWVDALQMAMPVFARFGDMYDDNKYYRKMWDLYHHTKYEHGGHGLYSDNADFAGGYHSYGDYLWWRDAAYDPPETSPNGDRVYWSRGNGWVVAAHVRTLEYLPETDPHYDEYLQTLLDMAASLKDRQLASGFWPVNLDDPAHSTTVHPNWTDTPETSGTAFFTYAIAWGINNGYLDDATYRPVVAKAWNAMVSTAVHPNGKLGWVQGVGKEPESSQPVTYESTADFGVGAFLLAGSEVVKMARGQMPVPQLGIYVAASDFSEVEALDASYTGVITAEFDVAPQRNGIDGVVCFADSSIKIRGYSSCAMLIRMSTNGVFDVRDGSTYRADATVRYNARDTYHVRMLTDLDAKTYDVYITAPGSAQVQIANDYAFRSDAPLTDNLGQICLKSGADGDYIVQDLNVHNDNHDNDTNLALDNVVDWSGQQVGNEAADACDGRTLPEARWSAQSFPQWIEIDLGANANLNRVRLFPYQNRAYQYRVEMKAEGGAYRKVVDRRSNIEGGEVIEDSFPPQTARYIRLTVTGAHGYTGGWVSIREFEVWGH